VLISAGSLLTLYLGLELMSLCCTHGRFDRDSGIAPSPPSSISCWDPCVGTLLYGMSIVYGVTGSLDSRTSRSAVHGGFAGNVGLALRHGVSHRRHRIQAGRVPFHMWIPDC